MASMLASDTKFLFSIIRKFDLNLLNQPLPLSATVILGEFMQNKKAYTAKSSSVFI